jgi:poly(3-hydroxybutyrate) depolymerase
MTKLFTAARSAALLASLFMWLGGEAASEPLPPLGADLSRTSVSGLSSGAYMAGQFQVAYSSLVMGAGIVAGGPYGCANTPGASYVPFWPYAQGMNLNRAVNHCMDDGSFFSGVPGVGELGRQARRLAESGRIDALDGLKGDKVYIFSGGNDETVERAVVERAAELYRELGVPEGNIVFVKHEQAAHAFITEEGGLACGKGGAPFINDCDYDQAKAILETLHGALREPAAAADSRYLAFDQAGFGAGPGSGMDSEGVAYIPEGCASGGGRCAVHVVFHGCKQGREKLGDGFIKASGFARWAEANGIIVLFPQIRAASDNPNGCWDWWGYTGRRFLEKEAPQMRAVRAMLGRLAEGR